MPTHILARPDWRHAKSKSGDDVPLDSPDVKVYSSRSAALAAEARLARKGESYCATTLVLARAYAKRGDVGDFPF